MERSLREAAMDGNVPFLLKLLHEDSLLLQRFIAGCYPETPLHIASMMGHVQFVEEILTRKPELAEELDCRKSSPLHLATAKGCLDIVKRLLQVKPNMCFACDRDGRNPLHIAATKGHLSVLKELVQARPSAARVLMKRGETVLHACVRYSQLEALKLLLEQETVADRELLNHKNNDGNSVLHLAASDKQIEAVKVLLGTATVEVNSVNADGHTVLDLVPESEADIAKSLEYVGAVRAKGDPSSNHELQEIVLSLPSTDPENQAKLQKKHKKKVDKDQKQIWLKKKKNALIVVASLLATMAFQAGVSPPNGVWQENSDGKEPDGVNQTHRAGDSIMADYSPVGYIGFLVSNTTGFVASLSVILLLVSGLPFRHRFFLWILMVIMWIAIDAMTLTYLIAIIVYTPEHESSALVKILTIVLLVWVCLTLLILVIHTVRLIIHTVRLIIRMIKFLGKLFWRKRSSSSEERTRNQLQNSML